MTIRATDISRYLGDAGHTPYRPIADDDTRPGRLLAVADPNTAATGQSGYRSEQVDRATVRTFHEGLHVQDRLRAAEERVRMGDPRIDISLRGALADVLGYAVDAYAATAIAARSVWGDETCDEAKAFIAKNGATAELLTLARAINGRSS